MNYEAIKMAMQAELDNPKSYYMPSSPSEFIRDRLFKECHWEEAAYAWGCFCRGGFNIPELDALNNKLNELNKDEKMPDWGTRGT